MYPELAFDQQASGHRSHFPSLCSFSKRRRNLPIGSQIGSQTGV
jgi:hypothetical protein